MDIEEDCGIIFFRFFNEFELYHQIALFSIYWQIKMKTKTFINQIILIFKIVVKKYSNSNSNGRTYG